jgi:hypothetical protein
MIEKHALAGRDERLFRPLLSSGDAAVTDRVSAIGASHNSTLLLGHANA